MVLNVKLIMQVFSVKTQLYCLINQRHVSATVSSHHQAYPKNREKQISNAVAILVGDLEPYSVLFKVYNVHGMCISSSQVCYCSYFYFNF